MENNQSAPKKNPLSNICLVEDRVDGVYITIPREKQGAIRVNDMIFELERAMVLNYDPDAITAVIQRGRGAPEKIGPPFRYYNRLLDSYVSVSIQTQKASMRINSMCIADGVVPAPEELIYCLKRKGVKVGINEEMIRKVIAEALYDRDVPIAEGLDPVDGKEAIITIDVEASPNSKPQQRSNGSVDYRDVKTFIMVKEGQVIARKTPATPGIPGKTVAGESVPATPGKDLDFPGGKNTKVSDDGKSLVAAKSGILTRDGLLFNVGELLTIEKNVDFSVGNVKYSGDIMIAGNVLPGFTIEADGNIVVKGEVESARLISRDGTVTVEQGVLGKGEAYIFGKRGIHLSFAQDTNLKSEGTISFEKHCLNCESLSEDFDATDPKASIIGGHIQVYHSLCASEIGNENCVSTKISIIDKHAQICKDKIAELGTLEDKLRAEIEPVEKQLKTKTAILKKSGTQITDRHREELRKWMDMLSNLNLKLKYVQKKTSELKDELKSQKKLDGFVKVTKEMFSGTVLTLYGRQRTIDSTISNKVFRMKNDLIEAES